MSDAPWRRSAEAVAPASTVGAAALAARALRTPYDSSGLLRANSVARSRLLAAAPAEQRSNLGVASNEKPHVLMTALKKAAGGGAAGAVAMAANVGALMWMRTTVCFQYRCVRAPAAARSRGVCGTRGSDKGVVMQLPPHAERCCAAAAWRCARRAVGVAVQHRARCSRLAPRWAADAAAPW